MFKTWSIWSMDMPFINYTSLICVCAFSSCYVFCSAARNHQCITEIARRDFWRDMFNRYNIYIYNKYYQMLSSTCCLGLIIHIYIYNLDKQAGSSAKILCGIPLWIVCPSSFFVGRKLKHRNQTSRTEQCTDLAHVGVQKATNVS